MPGWLAGADLCGAISLEGAKACARRSPDRRCRGDLAAFPTSSRYTAGDLPRVGQSRRRPHSRPACPAVLGSPDPPNRETIHALLQSSRKPSSPAFRRLEARFRDWYGCRSICLAPTICRSSSNSSGKTGWPPAASWPSAGPSSCPACDPAISARRPRRRCRRGRTDVRDQKAGRPTALRDRQGHRAVRTSRPVHG